jgi:hypothetical protein
MYWRNTLLFGTACVEPHSLDIPEVYEFCSVLNCGLLCCIIDENTIAILLVLARQYQCWTLEYRIQYVDRGTNR